MTDWIARLDRWVWGPWMLVLLIGTGIFLNFRTRFLPLRNLGWALRSALGREARSGKDGGVSPFSALMTTLAATIGTGNIAGVSTALVAGGPGALVWMEISALCGLSSKCVECLLAVKYRRRGRRGTYGGPMYVMRDGLRPRRLGAALAACFSFAAVLVSLGMGNMAQSNSIAEALSGSFSVPPRVTGTLVALLAFFVILGGIQRTARVCSAVVPVMAVFYLLAGLTVLLGHLPALP